MPNRYFSPELLGCGISGALNTVKLKCIGFENSEYPVAGFWPDSKINENFRKTEKLYGHLNKTLKNVFKGMCPIFQFFEHTQDVYPANSIENFNAWGPPQKFL